jgi:hypothetical protein
MERTGTCSLGGLPCGNVSAIAAYGSAAYVALYDQGIEVVGSGYGETRGSDTDSDKGFEKVGDRVSKPDQFLQFGVARGAWRPGLCACIARQDREAALSADGCFLNRGWGMRDRASTCSRAIEEYREVGVGNGGEH